MDLESKALGAPADAREMKEAFDEFRRTLENFKAENDERLQKLERRTDDVVTNEKVDRINEALTEQKRALDELALAQQRPVLGVPSQSADTREHKGAFDRYMRKGDAAGLDRYEMKALSTQSDPDGGYLVPRETETAIDRILAKVSPIRAIASVRQIGAQSYRKPITTAGASAGCVAGASSRPETNAPTLSVVEFPTMELYALPSANSYSISIPVLRGAGTRATSFGSRSTTAPSPRNPISTCSAAPTRWRSKTPMANGRSCNFATRR